MIRVLIAEDHSIVRAGLCRLIEDTDDIQVVAEAADGGQAIARTLETLPDVLIVDLSMPGIDGLEVISRMQAQLPQLPIIVLTMHEEEQYVFRAINAGARGYVTKRSAPENLVKAIRRVHGGGRYLTEEAAEALAVHMAAGQGGRSLLDNLSNREIQVLRRLALGQTNREIALSYNISVKTVDTYRQRLLKKLNLRNNAELSRFAIQNNLVSS
ncbi:MAG: response regulator transcription factor [Thermodesulfobacteriota bacterium]